MNHLYGPLLGAWIIFAVDAARFPLPHQSLRLNVFRQRPSNASKPSVFDWKLRRGSGQKETNQTNMMEAIDLSVVSNYSLSFDLIDRLSILVSKFETYVGSIGPSFTWQVILNSAGSMGAAGAAVGSAVSSVLFYKFPVGPVAALQLYQSVRRRSLWEELGITLLRDECGEMPSLSDLPTFT